MVAFQETYRYNANHSVRFPKLWTLLDSAWHGMRKCILLLPSRSCLFFRTWLTLNPTLAEHAGKGNTVSEDDCLCILLLTHILSIRAVHKNNLGSFVKTWTLPGPHLQESGLNWPGIRAGHLCFQ